MFRKISVCLIIMISLLSLSSSSILRKSISRRQADVPYCNAIENFECKCSYFRVTCTTTHDLSSPINIIENEKHKYQSVELVVSAAHDIKINDQTFEPVKQLYKSDGDNLEFRIKFEKFTGLHLSSSGIFNQVFPDNLNSNTRKHMALEIYNTEVKPNEDLYLFKNLNVDSLEVYGLYPFHGSFQQLFDGANIKYLRLSSDIRSDLSKQFTGNIARLEIAKQATSLSVQNFPVYPAHELIINAFYINEFNNEHPPNYSNLGELRVYTPERIPANAFQQFPNIHTLSITTEKDIDPKALNGLNNLEKLTIKESKPSITLLNNLPNLKEFETTVEKLDEDSQCQLVSKLANGQMAVQPIPNGRECTCVIAYMNAAAGRTPCDAQDCDHSTCSTIRNNYDSSTRTFKKVSPILRFDGTDALYQRQPKVYTTPYQVPNVDRDKLNQGIQKQEKDAQKSHDHEQHTLRPHDQHNQPTESQTGQDQIDDEQGKLNEDEDNQQHGKDDQKQDKETNENQSDGETNQTNPPESNVNDDGSSKTNTQTEESSTPSKKGRNWLPVIIIAAAIIALLLIGIVILVLRKRNTNKGYGPTPTTEQPASTSTTAARA